MSLLCVRGWEEEDGFGQLASHHRAPSSSSLLHTRMYSYTHTHTQSNENIISLSPCGSLLHIQRWLHWILSCLLEHDYTPKEPQLNITQMNSHFPTTIANWTQQPASQKAVLGPIEMLQVDISFKRDSQEAEYPQLLCELSGPSGPDFLRCNKDGIKCCWMVT